MPNLIKLAIAGSLLLNSSATLAQKPLGAIPKTPANEQIPIVKQRGNCPSKIGVWTIPRMYEGGYETKAIVDTISVVNAIELSSGTKKAALYTGKLKPKYANCKGSGVDSTGFVKAKFVGGNLNIQVRLPADTPSKPSILSRRSTIGNRPYVEWQVAD
jgi:hypothetical protein